MAHFSETDPVHLDASGGHQAVDSLALSRTKIEDEDEMKIRVL